MLMTNSLPSLARADAHGNLFGAHPFVWALSRASNLLGLNQSDVARAIGVLPQTIAAWKRFALANPDYLLPAEQVPPLADVLAVPMSYFRPDLWPDPTWRFKRDMTIHLRSQGYKRAG